MALPPASDLAGHAPELPPAAPLFEAQRMPRASFGAEVLDTDLADRLDAPFHAAALDALYRHKVLVFRDQELSEGRFRDLALGFGPLEPTSDRRIRNEPFEDLLTVTNVAPDGSLTVGPPSMASRFWHSDKSYLPRPPLATVVYAIDVPGEDGETEFCNLTAAYNALPAAMRKRIDGLRVRHHRGFAYDGKPGFPKSTSEQERLYPPVEHPLVCVHPRTGEKTLYLGYFAAGIVGMDEAEGRALLDELTGHTTQKRFLLAHRWRRGDVMIWDNRSLLHRARPFDPTTRARTLIRAVVQADVPA
ncbi:MAG: TauD/TfdA dioxygenase family protein [Alphaproteobacteria bacterium]